MVGCYYNSGITTEKIDALIKQEVPANADKAQVLAFLDAHAITHTDVAEFPKGYLEEPELDSDLSSDKLKGKVGRVRKYAVANIPTTKIRPLVTYNLIIKFYFDKDDRLVEYLVRSVGTGF
jgi:hypothetical protein